MSKVEISKKECRELYDYYYDAGNRFAASGVWKFDLAILFIEYHELIKKDAKFKFQKRKKFKTIYENDANFRYLIMMLKQIDKGE